jgi:hypothetical protein
MPQVPAAIEPTAVAPLDVWAAVLRLPPSCLRRAARRRELRVSCRGGVYLSTGAWVLCWVEAGEAEAQKRRQRKVSDKARSRLAEAGRQRLQS